MTAARPYREVSTVILEILNDLSGIKFLDVGCGSGAKSRMLADLGAEVTGIEPNETAVAKARETGGGPTYVHGSAMKLPFGKGAFDAAIFTDSLHHIPDPQSALREAARVVRPNGHILVLEPEADDPGYPVFRLINDEKPVYRQAQAAIDALERDGLFTRSDTIRFAGKYHVESVDALLVQMMAVDVSREFDATRRPELDRLFDECSERDEGGTFFTSWARLDVLTVEVS